MARKFTIIVGDIIASGKIKNRNEYWSKLNAVKNRMNKKYYHGLYAPLMVLKGDEVSAVLRDLTFAYPIIRDFQEMLYPYKIRFVSVFGPIDVALRTKNASIMDGPAFWNADEHLVHIKMKKKYAFFDFENITVDNLLTTVANLVISIKYKWTRTEREIISLYEKNKNQNKVAHKLGISQQSVSDALIRSQWKEVREGEMNILKTLGSYPWK